MNSHNTKTEKVVKKESVGVGSGTDSVRVLQMDLIDPQDLAIADDVNTGGDPYNSTGQHVIIKSRLDLED